VQATNAVGSGSGAVSVVAAATQVQGAAPLSLSDARFAGNTTSGIVTVPSGGTLSNRTITTDGGSQSILTLNGANLQNCAVASREAVRVAGSGNFTINNCYLEAVGIGDDHADALQCYSPGDSGTITVTNTTFALGGASNGAFFIADNWVPATVSFDNVVFLGLSGAWCGLKLHADSGGNIHVSLNNVYFVGSWGQARFSFVNFGGGQVIVDQWQNVRVATISGGVLVPGAVIPQP
jgi:hypothetical protein